MSYEYNWVLSQDLSKTKLEGVNHEQQLHQVLVHVRAGGLDDKDIRATHIVEDLEVDFSVRELTVLSGLELRAEMSRNALGQLDVCRAGHELEKVTSSIDFRRRGGCVAVH